MAYCWLHRRKNMANPEGEVSEIGILALLLLLVLKNCSNE